MSTITLKQQEIHAGGFTIAFGSYPDSTRTQFIKITGKTEGHTLLFDAEGTLLKISPNSVVPVVAPAGASSGVAPGGH